jgi:hypothetical protein
MSEGVVKQELKIGYIGFQLILFVLLMNLHMIKNYIILWLIN